MFGYGSRYVTEATDRVRFGPYDSMRLDREWECEFEFHLIGERYGMEYHSNRRAVVGKSSRPIR